MLLQSIVIDCRQCRRKEDALDRKKSSPLQQKLLPPIDLSNPNPHAHILITMELTEVRVCRELRLGCCLALHRAARPTQECSSRLQLQGCSGTARWHRGRAPPVHRRRPVRRAHRPPACLQTFVLCVHLTFKKIEDRDEVCEHDRRLLSLCRCLRALPSLKSG